MKKLFVIWISILLGAVSSVYAQQIRVQGFVYDEEDGFGIPGAGVFLKSTPYGTVTNLNGYYIIECPPDAILVYSAIGYESQEIPVNGQTIINVALEVDPQWPIFYGRFTPLTLALPVSNPMTAEPLPKLESCG